MCEWEREIGEKLKLQGEHVIMVDEFKYLGLSRDQSNRKCTREVKKWVEGGLIGWRWVPGEVYEWKRKQQKWKGRCIRQYRDLLWCEIFIGSDQNELDWKWGHQRDSQVQWFGDKVREAR